MRDKALRMGKCFSLSKSSIALQMISNIDLVVMSSRDCLIL